MSRLEGSVAQGDTEPTVEVVLPSPYTPLQLWSGQQMSVSSHEVVEEEDQLTAAYWLAQNLDSQLGESPCLTLESRQ